MNEVSGIEDNIHLTIEFRASLQGIHYEYCVTLQVHGNVQWSAGLLLGERAHLVEISLKKNKKRSQYKRNESNGKHREQKKTGCGCQLEKIILHHTMTCSPYC